MFKRFLVALLAAAGIVGWGQSVAEGQSIGRQQAVVRGTVLTESHTTVGTDADLLEKTLWTWDLPANTLSVDGQSIRITAGGLFAGNVDVKTVRIYVGACTRSVNNASAAPNGLHWYLDVTVQRRAATSILMAGTYQVGGTLQNASGATICTETLSSPITVKITGQNGTAVANDSTLHISMVELLAPGAYPASGLTISPILAPNGTAGAPAYSFASESTLGAYRYAAGTTGLTGNVNITGDLTTGSRVAPSGGGVNGRLGGATNGLSVTNPAGTNIYTMTVVDWGTVLSGETINVAQDAVVFLGASPLGALHITTSDSGVGTYLVRGVLNLTAEAYEADTAFSPTKDTASSWNIYYDAAGPSGAGYYLQNKRGFPAAARLVLIGL